MTEGLCIKILTFVETNVSFYDNPSGTASERRATSPCTGEAFIRAFFGKMPTK